MTDVVSVRLCKFPDLKVSKEHRTVDYIFFSVSQCVSVCSGGSLVSIKTRLTGQAGGALVLSAKQTFVSFSTVESSTGFDRPIA